ncbi:MAG: hypothetical protein Q9226_005554 [Calogaya cf. arnoldii]
MFTQFTLNQWCFTLALTLLSRRDLIHALSDATSTSTGLTQVGIASNCNAFTNAQPDDTCDLASLKFQISLTRLTELNPVLGYPDGKYCEFQFWAQYDYCVGTSNNSAAPPAVSGPSSSVNSVAIPGKSYTTLPNDRSPDAYTVDGNNSCVNSEQFFPMCWQQLNMNSWLPKWYLEEPQCVKGQNEVGCNIPGEPWTTTLVREYVGAGAVDCATLPGNCPYSTDPNNGEGIPELARARYRYAHYNIIGIVPPSPLSSSAGYQF